MPLPATESIFTCQARMGNIPKIAFNELDNTTISKILGWVKDPKANNVCGGYYIDPAIVLATPNPKPIKEELISVSAKNPSFFSEYGKSVLQGDVTITQPGREITADRVTIIRDKTGKISTSDLEGHVNLREYGKLIVSQEGHTNFVTKIHVLNNAIYRLLSETETSVITGWGKAKKIVRDSLGVLKLDKASYSTCPPERNSWHVWSNYLVLDKNTGRGTATNALFFVKNIPILYTPYFNFPIDDTRKSGFLYPTFGYSKDSGASMGVPYYFNLAPNYDFTLTPKFITKRGLLTEGSFRYLTKENKGALDLFFIPSDKAFATFRDQAHYTNKPSNSLKELEKAHNSRGLISYQNQAKISQHWSSNLDFNYVTDDYFLQDFAGTPAVIDDDQLPNQVDLQYSGENWSFLSKFQSFQTLHPLALKQTQDQYRRLPQLNLGGYFPGGKGGLDYQISTELVNFEHQNNFYNGKPYPIGSRFNIIPAISLPLNGAGEYLTPMVQLDATTYDLRNVTFGNKDNVSRVVPLFSLNSGLIFTRNFSEKFTQTLEPRLYYLYVPKRNQNYIQVFDTTLPQFDFNQMFRPNRFSGYDRIGDANQFAFALTTRLLDDYGQEKLNASIGEIIALHKHEVCLNNDCSLDPLAKGKLSPIVGQLSYLITPQISTLADASWNPRTRQVDTTNLNLHYSQDPRHLLSFWYNFGRDADRAVTSDDSNNLNRFGASTSWSVIQNWNILGSWNYNASHSHAQDYLYGIEYDTCCWAVRLVQSKVFINVNANGQNTFNRSVYLQILLKGLGSIGTSDAGSLLTTQISGYRDNFSSGFRL